MTGANLCHHYTVYRGHYRNSKLCVSFNWIYRGERSRDLVHCSCRHSMFPVLPKPCDSAHDVASASTINPIMIHGEHGELVGALMVLSIHSSIHPSTSTTPTVDSFPGGALNDSPPPSFGKEGPRRKYAIQSL